MRLANLKGTLVTEMWGEIEDDESHKKYWDEHTEMEKRRDIAKKEKNRPNNKQRSPQELVNMAQKYAKENYEAGLDTFVEAFTEDELLEFINDYVSSNTWEELKYEMWQSAALWKETRYG